jgi:1,2-dihydroxy-3-keto-5-methylthiopentene dioxygenase
MSELKVFADNNGATALETTRDTAKIAQKLGAVGALFEQWPLQKQVGAGDSQEAILLAYQSDVGRIVTEHGFVTVDVISLDSSNPNKDAMRQTFLNEHRHTEDEVRFFVDGCTLFYLHIENKIYSVLCERGDLLSVPANTPHWADLGSNPRLASIRFFNNPEGWVAQYTGSTIAALFPTLEN